MKPNPSAADFTQLSVSERILLAQDLWDSVSAVPEKIELTDEQKKELDRRLDLFHKDPKSGNPWETVKNRF